MTKRRTSLWFRRSLREGFTLLESLVMLGLVTVLTLVAVASWRKTAVKDSIELPRAIEVEAIPSGEQPARSNDKAAGSED